MVSDRSASATSVVAGNVRAEMGRLRFSQRDMGRLLGLSQPAVSRRLGGQVAFDVNELAAIAEHLQIPLSRLTAGLEGVA